MSSFKCKRISKGKYVYRGIEIICLGYYPPEQKVVWEGSAIGNICADYHDFTLKGIKKLIDNDLNK